MNLSELPFDQYQRYRAVSDVLRRLPGRAPESVLEVGAGTGDLLAAFMPETQVMVVDLETGGAAAVGGLRVRADARRPLPFRDGSFAVAVTIDTLEHLPPAARPALIGELRRVARGAIVIGCPVASAEAVSAEIALAGCYRKVWGHEHRWLAEHLAHGLPTPEEIAAALTSLGGGWQREYNGYLPEWQVLMLIHLLGDKLPRGALAVPEVRALNAHYNQRLYPFANKPPAYRMVWVQAERASDLPPQGAGTPGEAPAEDRAEFEVRLREAVAALPSAWEQAIADWEGRLAGLLAERARVDADRQRVDVARIEALAGAERLRVARDQIDIARLEALTECERLRADRDRLQRCYEALAADQARVNAERQQIEHERLEAVTEIARLRYRVGRLRPFEIAVDATAPLWRPVIRGIFRSRRVQFPSPDSDGVDPVDPYGLEAQERLSHPHVSSRVNRVGARASVTVVVLDPGGSNADAVARTRTSLEAQTVAPAAVQDVRSGEAWIAAARKSESSHVALLFAGDRLAPHALAEVAYELDQHPDATVVYTDHDEWPVCGVRQRPELKPEWDPELARAGGLPGGLACFRRDLFDTVTGDCSPAEVGYALALAASEQDERLAVHVPLVLLHLDPAVVAWRQLDLTAPRPRLFLTEHIRRLGGQGEAIPSPPGFRVRWPVDPAVLASILIPFRDQSELLARCVASIRTRTSHQNWELLLIDNGSTDRRTHEILAALTAEEPERVRVLQYPSPFNFSAINNFAAQRAAGGTLVLLNSDTEVLSDDWLATLIGLANRPGVGAVGPLLLFPDGRIQHCGIVLGMGTWPGRTHGVAGLLLNGCAPREASPLLYAFDRRTSAVTAACLAVRRDHYLSVGGMDEQLATDFNDVDLCLRLAEQGLVALYTPHVRLLHHESVTRAGRAIDPAEVELMYARWGDHLERDPHLSPHFDRASLCPVLATRPLSRVA